MKKIRSSLGIQLFLALLLGAIAGKLLPGYAPVYQFLGKAFIGLVNMVIIPLVLPIVVVSVANVIRQRGFGKLLSHSLLYFFVVTTAITLVFVFSSSLLGFGNGINIGQEGASIEGIASSIDWETFFLNFIPSNIFKSLSEAALLPIIVFAIFVGYAVGQLDETRSRAVISFLQTWIDIAYHIVNLVIAVSPIGIFGFVAKAVATTGLDKLIGLGQFVFGTYVAYAGLALVIFPLVALAFGIPYRQTIQQIWELLTVAFISGSSSVVLPPLLNTLKANDYDETVTDFVVPLGYTFNLEGAAVYFSVATIFIANAYGIAYSISGLFYVVFLLTLIGKTAATVPSGAIVVLLAAAPQLGLPVEGVALIFAVDFFVNAGRTALNVLGQVLAVRVIEKTSQDKVAIDEKLAVQA